MRLEYIGEPDRVYPTLGIAPVVGEVYEMPFGPEDGRWREPVEGEHPDSTGTLPIGTEGVSAQADPERLVAQPRPEEVGLFTAPDPNATVVDHSGVASSVVDPADNPKVEHESAPENEAAPERETAETGPEHESNQE